MGNNPKEQAPPRPTLETLQQAIEKQAWTVAKARKLKFREDVGALLTTHGLGYFTPPNSSGYYHGDKGSLRVEYGDGYKFLKEAAEKRIEADYAGRELNEDTLARKKKRLADELRTLDVLVNMTGGLELLADGLELVAFRAECERLTVTLMEKTIALV